MIELPEALNLAKQLSSAVCGKQVVRVLPPTKPHKFCWFCGEPEGYHNRLSSAIVTSAEGFGIFAEIAFDNGCRLCVNDGVNVRFLDADKLPKDYQLAVLFIDGSVLAFTVAMYGGICLHDGGYDNEYYIKSRNALSPFDSGFDEYFFDTLAKSKPTLSAKAFIATEQRFPGIGNGTLQDILFNARLHPKRKLSTLDGADTEGLLASVKATLHKMTDMGGRDTEKDLFGNHGGYVTLMSKNTLPTGCPVCAGAITKEAYLGGSVYYCPHCQPQE